MSLSSKLLLTNSQLTRRIPIAALPQVRTQWYQDEVRSIRDPVTGKWRYEQPRQVIQRFKVVRLKKPPREYEKPWMRRRRIADEKIYRSKKKVVNELLNYIKFTKEAGEAREAEWAFSETDKEETS